MERGKIKMDNEQFIRDCLGRKLSFKDIEKKYGIADVLTEYMKVKKLYSQDEIDAIFEEVYYNGNANRM